MCTGAFLYICSFRFDLSLMSQSEENVHIDGGSYIQREWVIEICVLSAVRNKKKSKTKSNNRWNRRRQMLCFFFFHSLLLFLFFFKIPPSLYYFYIRTYISSQVVCHSLLHTLHVVYISAWNMLGVSPYLLYVYIYVFIYILLLFPPWEVDSQSFFLFKKKRPQPVVVFFFVVIVRSFIGFERNFGSKKKRTRRPFGRDKNGDDNELIWSEEKESSVLMCSSREAFGGAKDALFNPERREMVSPSLDGTTWPFHSRPAEIKKE